MLPQRVLILRSFGQKWVWILTILLQMFDMGVDFTDQVWKWIWNSEARSENNIVKLQISALKQGQGLENQVAHPNQTF